MNTKELLTKAALILGENGWVQGSYGPDRGDPHCVLGALNEAAGRAPVGLLTGPTLAAANTLLDHLGLPLPSGDAADVDGAVADWNDQTGRTAAEVIAALRGAASGG